MDTIELPLAHMIPEGVSNLLLPVCVFGYLIFMDWRIALASLACVPVGAVVFAIMMRNYSSQYDKYMKASEHVNSVIVEYTEGIQVIKAFSQSTDSYQKYADSVRSFKDFTLGWFRSTWGLMSLGGAILPSPMLGILPVGVLLYCSGALTPAQLTLAMILSMSIIGPVSWFTNAVNEYKSIQYAVRNIEEILEIPELQEKAEEAKLNGSEIVLSGVRFAYNSQDGDVLRGIDLALPQGSFTALVGPSGGGKSTLAKLIARFWDVSSGSITLGGVDIREIPLKQLSENISYVAQDNFLFNRSLFENIRMGKPTASDAEVMAAAEAAQCGEFISRLEQGWDTPAGEAGGKLSGGERQRIAIARAILKNAPIVILDEATASVDPENEHLIQSAISELARGKTLITIAHRLATIENAQQILVVDGGHIVQRGTHRELISQPGRYADFVKIREQSEGWKMQTS